MNTDKVTIKNEKENELDIIVLGLLLIDIIMNSMMTSLYYTGKCSRAKRQRLQDRQRRKVGVSGCVLSITKEFREKLNDAVLDTYHQEREKAMEMIALLRQNGQKECANEVFEAATYIDSMEKKLDAVAQELVTVREQLQKMEEQKAEQGLNESYPVQWKSWSRTAI